MVFHLTKANIESYLAGTLQPDELLTASDHLSECEDCAAAAQALAPADGFAAADLFPQHLKYEEFEALVNGSASDETRIDLNSHLSACASCSAEFREMVSLRKAIAEEVSGTIANTADPLPERSNEVFWSWFRLPVLVPAFVLLAALAFVFVWLRGQTEPPQIADVPVPVDDVSQSPLVEPAGDANANLETPAQADRVVVASLTDANGKIEIDKNGEVTGLSSPQFESKVRRALTDGELSIPKDAGSLSRSAGVLMSGNKAEVPFALTYPVGKFIESRRPAFQWKPAKNAETYKVEIFDENFAKVAASPPLNTTTWSPPELERGRIYVWQVTAMVNGEEVRSPVRPAPDARFKVIDAGQAANIAAAKRSGSNLTLGIAFAEAGMLAEARNEFLKLQKRNPGSPQIQALLRRLDQR